MAVFLGRQSGPFAVSMALAAYFLGVLIFAPLWGAVSDALGKRKVILVLSGFLSTLVLVTLLFNQGVVVSILVRGLYGATVTGFSPIMLALMSESGGKEGRGRSVGFFNSSRASGFAAGRFTAGFLVGLLVPKAVYAITLLIGLLSTLLAVMVEDPGGGHEITWREVREEVKERVLVYRGKASWLKESGLNWLYTAVALRHMTVKGIGSLLPVYITLRLNIAEPLMGMLLSINPVLQIVFMQLSGWLGDNLGRRPLIIAGTLGSGLFALMASLASFSSNMSLRIALVGSSNAVLAAAFSGLSTGASAFIGDVASLDTQSQLQGFRFMSVGIGGVLGPVLIGTLASIFSYRSSFILASLLAFVAALLVTLYVEETKPELDKERFN